MCRSSSFRAEQHKIVGYAATHPTERSDMDDSLRELLDDFGPEVRRLALSLRARVRDLVPDAQEKVIGGYKSLNYGFGSGMRDQFAAIVLHKEHVNLQVPRGVDLPDPGRMLEGTGKAMRHVKIRTDETIRSDEIKELVESAAALARP
jgi:hypothetical protein